MCSEEMCTLLSGHLDGCNTPEQESALENHLAQCEDCRRILAEYEQLDADIAGITKEPPAGFTSNVMNAISVEVPKPTPQRRFPMRYGTAIAAVAAVFLIVVSTGKISLPREGTTAIYPEAPVQEEAVQALNLPQGSFAAPSDAQKSDTTHANVDCAALANADGCPVAVVYTADHIAAVAQAPTLALSGATRYTITQGQLQALQADRSDLTVYLPDDYSGAEDAKAYLIVVKPN